MIRSRHIALCAAMFLVISSTVFSAELSFSRHYTNNMVLQREKPVLIRGFADAGTDVTVTFSGQTKEARADENGEWTVILDSMKANDKGGDLTASTPGTRPSTLKNVLVGDVFLFARQTTIDIRLGRDEAGKKAAADVPSARVITIETVPAYDPQKDLDKEATSGWTTLTRDAALKMDAAAFYMTKDLATKTDVPIGIINVNMGRHFAIGWMSKEALLETKAVFGEQAGSVDSMIRIMDGLVNPSGKQKGRDGRRSYPRSPACEDARFPAAGYNAVLHPMRGLALKALLLQLGNDYPYFSYAGIEQGGKGTSRDYTGQAYEDCYDVRKWSLYLASTTIPRLPKELRRALGDDTLPVGWITPPGSELDTLGRHHAEVRELQRRAVEKESGVGLIMPGTESIFFSAQPADDALLGSRCLAWLQGAVYRQDKMAPTGPVFDRAELNGGTAQIFFMNGSARGLRATEGALDCFEVAAATVSENPTIAPNDNLKYTPAKATIDGETIRLTSDTVQKIAYIRYNWREKPDQGLVGESGLPAIPFNTDGHDFPRRINRTEKEKLPPEFFMSIADWKSEGPVIYDGQLVTGLNNGKVLGPTGLKVTVAYNRNLYVNNAYVGSPADGKILPGDFLYGVSGNVFGDDVFADVAEAITLAETEEARGILSFNVLRNSKKITVDIQLEVLGAFSNTSPYNCPKTDRIVAKAEAHLARLGGTTPARRGKATHPVFANAESLFLLAAGTPEYQGLVRRQVYNQLEIYKLDQPIDPNGKGRIGSPWNLSADMLLLSEYYLATGDTNVLPYLRYICDALTSIQIRHPDEKGPWPQVMNLGQMGGWRHNFYGGAGYGTMPAIGVPAVLGYHLAKEAGVEYNFVGYDRAVHWFHHNGAQIGNIVYGYFKEPRTTAKPIDTDLLAAGKLSPGNGAVAGAAILYDLIGDEKISKTNSHVATHCYNNTGYAHGGHFWANLYTPLGAKVDGKTSFQLFMKGNRNYQTIHRLPNYSRDQGRGFGYGQYLAYVAPLERLRILGAHESVFAPNPPEALKAALEAYHKRDYAGCEAAVKAALGKGGLKGLDLRKGEQLRDAAGLIQKSIASDLAKVQKLIAEKKPYEASLDLAQLKAVMPDGSAELGAIETALNQPEMKKLTRDDKKRYETYLESLALKLPTEVKGDDGPEWQELVSQGEYRHSALKPRNPLPKPTTWRVKVVESITQAPEGWTSPDFDDSTWSEGVLPFNWRENHTILLRAPFDVADPAAIGVLRFNQHAKHMDGMEVSINGEVVARISAVASGRVVNIPLNDHALSLLKKGTNTLAATYRNQLRWGSYFKGPHSASGGGLNITLEMQEK